MQYKLLHVLIVNIYSKMAKFAGDFWATLGNEFISLKGSLKAELSASTFLLADDKNVVLERLFLFW